MTRSILPIVLLFLIACGSEPPPPDAAEAESESAPEPHFLSEQQKALEKARQLQEDMNTQVKNRLEEIDKQTRDDRDEGDQ